MDDVAMELAEDPNNDLSVESKRRENSKETTIDEMQNKSKDSSMEEDLLGSNTLLLSDSDDDCETQRQTTPEKLSLTGENKNIIASEDLQTNKNVLENEQKITQKKKKVSSILDSDTEDDETKTDLHKEKPISRTKISTLIDTDTESESELHKPSTPPVQQKKYHRTKIVDCGSESDEEKFETERPKKKKAINKQKVVDSNSDTNLSDQDDNDAISQEEVYNLGKVVEDGQDKGKSKPMRAAAKKAVDDMQAIQSEQQRLCRETHLSVPYHKPKRRTLDEFLKRRTIIKPTGINDCNSAAGMLQKKNLKMTGKELEEYAKLMEERAKEATEFFKSESESDDNTLMDNDSVLDAAESIDIANEQKITESTLPQNGSDASELLKPESTSLDTMETVESTNDQNITETNVPLEEKEEEVERVNNNVIPNVVDHEMEVDMQPIVTEILKLPTLDMSAFHINEQDEEPSTSHSHRNIEKIKKSILHEEHFQESPKLKGGIGSLIVLQDGDPIKPTGPDNLLQRLLSTHKARKAKTSETVNILSNDGGKLEITKVDIHLHDDDPSTKEQKPGAAYFKLKENLKSLIKNKRMKEMQRKLDDIDEYNKCLEGDDDEEEDDEEYEIEGDVKVKKTKDKRKFAEIVVDDEENAIPVEELGDEAETEAEEEDDDEENDNEYFENEAEIEEDDPRDNGINAVSVEIASDESSSDSDDDENKDEVDNNMYKNEFKEPQLPTTQRKTRIIKGFAVDSDVEDEDDLELLKTQPPQIVSNMSTTIFGDIDSPTKPSVFNIVTDLDKGIADTQELMDLCSGTFDATQNITNSANEAIISQIPITQHLQAKDATAELLDLCSGTFGETEEEHCEVTNTQTEIEPSSPLPTKKDVYKILSSDEENANKSDAKNRVKRLRKKLKKGQTKLGFSDDEEDVGEHGKDTESEIVETIEDDGDNIPETYIEYDSEENEIVVELSKNDHVKRAKNFLENEAELSESEWGSADEDEKNMDHYDIELGDEDEFDSEKLQRELGQIHTRKMLDEDIREVRKIQEMLFEDEENDGVGRQRQFRWKNGESGFSLDLMHQTTNGDDGGSGESGDEEQKQENLWRKIRFEREQLLKEKGLKENSQELPASSKSPMNPPLATILLGNNTINGNSNTPTLNAGGVKKLQIITKKSTSTTRTKQKGSPFLISLNTTAKTSPITPNTPTTTSILQPKVARGSFLMRDKETLTKFASLTKAISAPGYDDSEATGIISTKTMASKNFVFATLTKEEHEHMKRKADDLMNSSSEHGTNFMKKPRLNAQPEKQCLIDQLL